MKNLIVILFIISLGIESNSQTRRSIATPFETPAPKPKETPPAPKLEVVKRVNQPVEEKKSEDKKPEVKSAKITKTKTEPNTKTSKVKKEEPEESESVKKTAPTTSFFTPANEMSKMSTLIELGSFNSDDIKTVTHIYGVLGLHFDFGRQFYIGPYGRYKIASLGEYELLKIEGKLLNPTTLNDWGAGLNFGSYIPFGRSFLLSPELRVGYNEYTIQSDTFSKANKAFIHHTYINFNPKLNLGFKMSEYSILNLHGGYVLPYYLGGKSNSGAYNPGTFNYGLSFRFYLPKLN